MRIRLQYAKSISHEINESIEKNIEVNFLFVIFIMMSGCVSARDGETFVIGIASELSKPDLEYAILINDENTIRVNRAGSHVSFETLNDVVIPDEIEFFWRAAGDKLPHAQKIRLRKKIPSDVLEKIRGNFATHYFSIEFLVINNKPYFRWNLIEILPGQTGNFKEVSRGGHW